jgi:hypothetical protein
MRTVLVVALVLVTAAACRAEDTPKASGILEGQKVKFPEKVIADGVKATVGLLESCSDHSLYDADELKKAKQGDHIRLVFPKPITVRVVNEEVEVSELVFRLPTNTGVFWLRSGEKWGRYSKYQVQKEEPFRAWLGEAEPAD